MLALSNVDRFNLDSYGLAWKIPFSRALLPRCKVLLLLPPGGVAVELNNFRQAAAEVGCAGGGLGRGFTPALAASAAARGAVGNEKAAGIFR